MSDFEHEQKLGGYYVPLADLLTGLVFILVILLTAITITSRPEFEIQLEVDSYRKKLVSDFKRLQELDAKFLRPRDESHQTLDRLLEDISMDLRSNGLSVSIDKSLGSLFLPVTDFFEVGGDSLINARNISIVAQSLAARLSCLSEVSVKLKCDNASNARISRVLVLGLSISTNKDSMSEAYLKAAILYGRLLEVAPQLRNILDNAGRPAIGHGAVKNNSISGFQLVFEMEKPILPPDIWLQEGAQ